MTPPLRFVVDQPVSPQIAHALRGAGFDAIHVVDRGMSAAPDSEIFTLARREARVIVTQDNDFSALLALSGASEPSVIRFQTHDGRPATHIRLLLTNLPRIESDLAGGAIVVFEDGGIRVRHLPIGRP